MHTNITLVIPALAFDFVHFADPLYESFERLTVLPEEVLMVVSNTSSLELNTTKYIKEKERFLQLQVDTGMRIRLLEYNYPVLQSVAKNIGAASATRQWVSVFDVDDVLHSQRFEVLDQVFKVRPEVNAVLTQFSFTTSAELKNNSVPVELYYTMDEIYNRTYDPQWIREEFAVHLEENNMALKGETPYSWCCPFIPNSLTANGWVSVKKDVWMKHQQRNNLPLGEDIEFNTRLIAGGENLTVVYANLGFYRWKSDAERPE
ncbi:hypothetical protein SARC_11760 [Sphaeroforma arctica JP610]|uniref:Glycosyltransferase 2-like domain-containing protein n=1 Tax=Sphaeroforma arctica JP610 TaxID=667725 RepID=A0A0L0FI66_9EUKA|nr:hypothetical protein SARC_11760 [Sphaeroforma arctica JP610]KNC75723.1 hypothetical protein SARC_11760 [Sphaeroforma arctica JP610]|eukprot:XP_014149625.1 hypothetical protein SARC_11760 [Sphaeroforma arctica JP610]